MKADPELRLIRSFLAVAEDRHFGRAARRLRMTQPALSRQIRRLEDVVGAVLLARTSRQVELTPAGEAFRAEVSAIFTATDRAVSAARHASLAPQLLVVGFIANAAAELTPRILHEFQRSHPSVDVELRQFDFADPSAGLDQGETDVALVRLPLEAGNDLALDTLFTEPRVLITSSTHPLVGRRCVTMEMVLDEPFVARNAPPYWRDYWLATCLRQGHEPRLGAETATVDECLEAVLLGRGIAFTQQSSQRFYARPGLAFVPAAGLPPSAVAVAWRPDAAGPVVEDFVAIARRVAEREWPPQVGITPVGGPPEVRTWEGSRS